MKLVAIGLIAMMPFWVFGQGSLQPPGAPGPVMRSLDQLEPRIPITNVPMTIQVPGVYYFTGNLTCSVAGTQGIHIVTSDVVIDLNGFCLTGPGSTSLDGIVQAFGISNATVRGGTLKSWSGTGARAVSLWGANNRVEKVNVLSCASGINCGDGALVTGCQVQDGVAVTYFYGLSVGNGSIVRDCIVRNCHAPSSFLRAIRVGAGSVLSDCTVSYCTSAESFTGIDGGYGSTLERCAVFDGRSSGSSSIYGIYLNQGAQVAKAAVNYLYGNGSTAYGIYAEAGAAVKDCVVNVVSNGGGTAVGVYAAYDGRVEGNTIRDSSYDGIVVNQNCQVLNNNCSRNGTYVTGGGLVCQGQGNNLQGNSSSGNGYGIFSSDSGNIIARNSARDNTVNDYQLNALDTYGPIVSISGNFTNTTAASHPWANFSY